MPWGADEDGEDQIVVAVSCSQDMGPDVRDVRVRTTRLVVRSTSQRDYYALPA